MNVVGIIIISVIGFFAVIGLIAGAVKGFSRAKSWAVELVLTGIIAIPVSRLVADKSSGVTPAIISLAITVALACMFMAVCAFFRKLISSQIEKRKQLSYYEQYDEREDNTEQILSAIGTEDKKQYKQLTKRKFKEKGGGWSIADRIIGAVTLALKGAVIFGIIFAIGLTVVDFSRLASEGGKLYDTLGDLYKSGTWKSFKNYVFDFILIGIIIMCIKNGYRGGLFSSLWSVAVIGLVVGAGVLAYYLAFKVDDFASVAETFEGTVSGWVSGISGILDKIGLKALTIAKIIIAVIIFLLMLVAVILIAVFVPKLINKARDGVIFRSIDGVFGAVVLTALVLGILLAVGAVANSMHDLKFMDVFNAYFEKSGIATFIYDKNLLNAMGVMNNLPLKNWFS